MTTPRPKRRTRRFLQFSLRSLLVFVLLVSIGMSWLGVKLQRARKQREAVEAIEKAGGFVIYEQDGGSSVPEWARAIFGDDFFVDVVEVVMPETDFGDYEATYLKGLTDLTGLYLIQAQITDAGLEYLEGLTSLTCVSLQFTQVTDAGLAHLKGLANLERLCLCGTQVTDAGLEHLEGLTSLTSLDLKYTEVTDAGLEHLKGLTNLERLHLDNTQVTAQGGDDLRQALPNCDIYCQ